MPRYQIRDGERLAHAGQVHEGGDVVELPRAIAEDMAVGGAVQEVDAAGEPVASVPTDDLERFRAHERVSILRDRLAAAQARVTAIEARLAAEEQAVVDEIEKRRSSAIAPAPAPAAAKAAPVKES